jgi:hypothetical protein
LEPADATWDFAQAVGNGAIVNSLTCGRPYCDGGQAVQKLERIRRRVGRPRNGRAKAPSLPASTVESGSGRARIAKGRRGSDAMARVTGRNQCSPLPLFWAGSCMFFPPDSMHAVVFSRKSLCDCTQSCSVAAGTADRFFVCNAIPVCGCGTLRAPLAMSIKSEK